jgi:acyl carrier protein
MSSDTEQRVRVIVERVAKKAQAGFSAEADIYRELGVESTAALDLLLSLEEEFGVQLDDGAFAQALTVQALCALIEKEAG